MKINDFFMQERKKQKISRREMAENLYISEGTYRDIESGKIRLSLENFLLICKILKISPLELLKENEDDHLILISKKDIQDLNRIISKINKQAIISDNNSNSINIGGNVNNSFNNSFNNMKGNK